MSNKFEPFRPLRVSDLFGDLFDDEGGISPVDAGKVDAREAMASAKEILRKAAKEMKLTKAA